MTTSAVYSSPRSALSRVFSEAPLYPRCSSDKTASIRLSRESALTFPYMQVNCKNLVSWLIFDIDHDDYLIWESAGLPAPNLTVRNRNKVGAHFFYAITPVSTGTNSRDKPIEYMRAVYRAYCTRLKADPAYSGPVAKTPGHRWYQTWDIHNDVYSLGELADYVELENTRWKKAPDYDSVAHSRHCTLFEEIRFYSYKVVTDHRKSGNFSTFFRDIEAYAARRNDFKERGHSHDLLFSQVAATVKSVTRWTWQNYNGGDPKNRGVMRLDSDLPLHEKQRRSANRTNHERKQAVIRSIKAALRSCTAQGLKATATRLASISRLSRQTVSKYLPSIENPSEDVLSPPKNVVDLAGASTGESSKNKNVNHGVYQINNVCASDRFIRTAGYTLLSTHIDVDQLVKDIRTDPD